MRKGAAGHTRRKLAAGMALACARVAIAGTPTFNSGTVTLIHDLDITDPSTIAARYESMIVTPTSALPGSYQLNNTGTNALINSSNSGTSSASASVARVQNSTTTTLTLAAGTGISQTDPSSGIGSSSLRINVNDLTWTPNTTLGPLATGYFSIVVGGTVAGSAQFSANLTFKDQYNNPLRSAITFGPTVFTSSSTLPKTYTSSAVLSSSVISSTTKIRLNGSIEFQANNDAGPTNLSPISIDAGIAPPTAIWTAASGGTWHTATHWSPPSGSVIDDPGSTIPTIANGRGQRAFFANPGSNQSVTLDSPVTLGTLDIDAASLTLNGTSTLTMSTYGHTNPESVINLRRGSNLVINTPVATAASLAVNTDGGDLHMLGTFTATAGTLTKSGEGRLVLTDANAATLLINGGGVALHGTGTFTRVILNSGGSLVIGNGTTNGIGNIIGPISTSKGLVVFNRPDSFTFSQQITGSGEVEQLGSGTTVITGSLGHSGATTISQGVLAFNGGTLLGNVVNVNGGTLMIQTAGALPSAKTIHLAAGGAMDVTALGSYTPSNNTVLAGSGGTVYGNVSHNTGTIESGGSFSAGTVNFANDLTLNGGKLNFDLGSTTTTGSGVNDYVNVAGNLTLTAGIVTINSMTGVASTSSVYRLMDYAGALSGAASNLTLVNNTRNSVSLSAASGQLNLTINSAGAPANLVWTGSPGNTWNVNSAETWLNGASPDRFFSGDSVTFNDNGAAMVGIPGKVLPASVTVNNSTVNYTFTGGGRIGGTASLIKQGAGSLTMTGLLNEYTGPTRINGGVLSIAGLPDGGVPGPIGASSSNASNLVLDGGTLRNLAGGVSDRLFSIGTSNGTIDASGSGSFTLTNPGAIGFVGSGSRGLYLTGTTMSDTLSASIGDGSGGPTSVVKLGSGRWTLTGDNTYTGVTNINGGTLVINGTHNSGMSYVYTVNSGGVIGGNGSIDAQVDVLSGGGVAPGASVGTLNVGTLALNDASLFYEVDAFGADKVIVNQANGLYFGGLSTFILSNLGGAAPGTYSLIDYNGTPLANISSVTLSSSSFNGYAASLVNNTADTSIDLQLSVVNRSWSGGSVGSWSTASNWGGTTPNGINQTATLPSSISVPTTITLDTPRMIGRINFETSSHSEITGNTLTIDSDGTDSALSVTAGNHTISAPVVLNKYTQATVTGGSSLELTQPLTSSVAYLAKNGAGMLQLRSARIPGLLVNQGAVIISSKATPNDPAGTSVVKTLAIESGSTLDLTNNSMVIDYADPDQSGGLLLSIRSAIQDGRLTSSSATSTRTLGYADNSSLGFASFGGQAVDSTSTLIKFTYRGDANLDGLVDIRDLHLFIQNFNGTNKFWMGGDFDYDGDVDRADLSFLARNWQAGVGNPLGGTFSEALQSLDSDGVPEPGNIGIVSALMWLLKHRRRRCS